MDFVYSLVKFLHVISAVAWVGGGLTLFAVALIADRSKDEATVMHAANITASLGLIWFMPASLATLVFGLIAAALWNWWGQAWIILGMIGFLATFATGLFVIKPKSEKIAALNASGSTDEARTHGRELMRVAKFDYTLLVVIIADMTIKPQWSDWAWIVIFALVLLAAAVLFLGLVERIQKMMPPAKAA